MKAILTLPLLLLLVIFKPAQLAAQYNKANCDSCANEVRLSEGIASLEQLEGWAGRGGMNGYVSRPSSLTGAAFITYRRFIIRKFAIGITAGLDNESGDLSYSNRDYRNSHFNFEGTSGHYRVRTYTIAVEPLLAYIRKRKFMFYGYLGFALTSFENTFTFYANIREPEYFYGPKGLVPSNPYTYHAYYANAQVTPIGMRFGTKFAFFWEFGFGYKGLFNIGLSAKF